MNPSQTKDILEQLLAHQDLSPQTMREFVTQMMSGSASPVAAGAILIALRAKGESIEELVAAAQVMREFANTVTPLTDAPLLDIVGTGGDGTSTFNISTTCLFVIAAAGGHVAKHGNRSVSSKSGSADAIEALGANLSINSTQVASSIRDTGMGFMFAPNHHPAMRHISPIRKELGVRTLFNMIGPLANPANAPHILMGVFSPHLLPTMSQALQQLGTQRALIVHSQDGMDEVSIFAPTDISELKDGHIRQYTLNPQDYGFTQHTLDNIQVDSPAQSIALIHRALSTTEHSAAQDIVLLNSGVALYTLGLCNTIQDGIECARATIASGAAHAKIDQYVRYTQQYHTAS